MKKIFYYSISVLFAAFALSSCNLTRLPEDDVTPEKYFTSGQECELWLNRCYYNLLLDPNTVVTQAADDYVMANPDEIVIGKRLTSDNQTEQYEWGWETIRRINYFFEHCSNCKDEEALKENKGVAYFFRALAYFEKVQRYGDVPWHDKVIGSSDEDMLRKARDPRGYVMLNILSDLDNAIAMLDETHDVSRVNKWTALALKSRVCLWEGTWRVYHASDAFAPKNDPTTFNGSQVTLSANYFLEKAAAAAKEVIDNGGYSLYNASGTDMNYRMLFATEDAREEEVILAKLFEYDVLKFGHNFQSKYYEQAMGFTKRFVNHYLMKDGTPYVDKGKVWYLDEDWSNRDPRMAQTIMAPGYVQLDQKVTTINDLNHCYTGFKPIKYIYNEDCKLQGKANNDFPYFRLAEVMLNYAEALAELGQLDQAALDKSINKIRARVGMPALSMSASLDSYMAKCYPNYTRSNASNKALLLEVRRERTIELVLEGFRQFDLLRWAEGSQMVNGGSKDETIAASPYWGTYLPGVGVYDMDQDGKEDFEVYDGTPTTTGLTTLSIADLKDRLYDPDDPDNLAPKKGYLTGFRDYMVTWDETKDYLFPIPTKQITLSNGTLTQNPGW